MEYTSPSNHIFVYYPQAQLTVLSIRSHIDGHTLFGSRLKEFLIENDFIEIINHLVSFERISSDITHKQLLENIQQESHGEGYVVEIIHPDQSSYLVKIKTIKYLMIHRDGDNANSSRSLFERIINEYSDDLKGLFQHDQQTLKRIDEMEQYIRPIYNRMIRSIEQFYQINKHLSKKDFIQLIIINENIKIYLPLLIKLYSNEQIDYKGFAIKYAKDLFGIHGDGSQLIIKNQDEKHH